MSLNGLDAGKVTEVYQAALKEIGGWFLLKYITRDEIDVLQHGPGGIAEVRDAIMGHEEKSPLYGFVHYRRKKVLLKYVPDGTSRLLQARVAVHFQAVEETFTHDTVLPIANPSELNETSLSSSVSFLRASASIKSSTSSLGRKRLTEITEDVPENKVATAGTTANKTKQDASGEKPQTKDSAALGTPTAKEFSPVTKESPQDLDKSLPAIPQDAIHRRDYSDNHIFDTRPSIEGRRSSQSARPSISDVYGSPHKPKAKVGPRPSLEYGRANTTGSFPRTYEPRPVSILPAGVHMPSRKPVSTRPQSQQVFTTTRSEENSAMNTAMFSKSSVISPTQTTILSKPSVTAGNNASISTQSKSSDVRAPVISLEKQRLMKALEMRKKQMEKKISEQTASPLPEKSDVEHQIAEVKEHETRARALEDVSASEKDPDIVHVGIKDINDGNAIASPISVLEPSEGSSTNASSVAETEGSGLKRSLPSEQDLEDHSQSELLLNGQESNQAQVYSAVESLHIEDATNLAAEQKSVMSKGIHAHAVPESSLLHTTQSTREPPHPHDELDIASPLDVPLPPCDEEEEEEQLLEIPKPYCNINQGPTVLDTILINSTPTHHTPDAHSNLTVIDDPSNTRPSSSDSIELGKSQRKAKRRGLVDTLKIISSAEHSDDNYLSDDSFMEELQSATVQEAKPISVSRSPVTPVFPLSPRSPTSKKSMEVLNRERTLSNEALERDNPQDRNLLTPEQPTPVPIFHRERESSKISSQSRAVSNPLELDGAQPRHHLSPEQNSPNRHATSILPTPRASSESMNSGIPKKVGVSSLISQRIKALEKFSSPTGQPAGLAATITPSIVTKRKYSFNTPSVPDSTSELSKWKGRNQLAYPTPSPSPHSHVITRKFGSRTVDQSPIASPQPESISVTATIIRDTPNERSELRFKSSDSPEIKFHHSPLVVKHQSSVPSNSSRTTIRTTPSKAGSVISDTSSPEAKRESLTVTRRASFASRRSVSSRKSLEIPRPLSRTSSDDQASIAGSEEKKESRRSRLAKRMSNITSASRRSIAHVLGTSVKEEPIVERQEPDQYMAPAKAIEIGDLNVQFPDTLLWKRRNLMIDSQGFLVLSPSKADESSRVAIKRYHLSDFHAPYIPDQDRQELPNSVILDFSDSSTLQCACENAAGQNQVLRALFEAYRIHSSTSSN